MYLKRYTYYLLHLHCNSDYLFKQCSNDNKINIHTFKNICSSVFTFIT